MVSRYFIWGVILAILFLGVGCDKKGPKKSNSTTVIDLNPTGVSTSTKTSTIILPMDTKSSAGTSTTNNGNGKPNEEETGAKLDPDASKYAQEGSSYFKQGKEAEAFDAWNSGVAANAKDTNSLFCLAQYYWDNGDEEESLDLYRRFYEANPSSNLKKQVGRTFKRASVDSYEDLMSVLKNRSSRKEHQSMMSDLKQRIRDLEASARDFDKRDEPGMAAGLRAQAEQLKSKLQELENE